MSVKWITIFDSPCGVLKEIRERAAGLEGFEIHEEIWTGGPCVFGIHQKNRGIDLCETGFYCLLDDDNIIHPDFFRRIGEIIRSNPNKDAFAFNQKRWDKVGDLKADPMLMVPGKIDNSMFVVHIDVIGADRYDVNRAGAEDGIFFQALFRKTPESFLFVDEFLSYYNYIRHFPGATMGENPVSKKDALSLFEPIEGWFSAGEGALLYDSAIEALSQCKSKAIVEIGSYLGRSTVILAAAASNFKGAKVYAIDPHEGDVMGPNGVLDRKAPTFLKFMQNIERSGLGGFVEPIRKRSCDVAWKESIAFLFVDGLHDHRNVSGDYGHYRRHVEKGGGVAFHDYHDGFPEVDTFVDLITTTELERIGNTRFLVTCKTRGSSPRFDVPLIVTSYVAPEIRSLEFAECLWRNSVNPFISNIHVLIEEPWEVYEKALREGSLRSMAESLGHPKIKMVPFGRRAHYRDVFDYAGTAFPGRAVVVSNADIWFDASLGRLDGVDLNGRFIALTRIGKGHMAQNSQDTWIFRAPVKPFRCDWFMGPRGSENKVAYEANQAGLEVVNPFPDIQTHHVHASEYRVGPTAQTLPGPYLYIHPSPLDRLKVPRR